MLSLLIDFDADDSASAVSWYGVPVRFLFEVLIGSFAFGVVAALAVAANLFVRNLETQGISIAMEYGLRAAESALFFADLALFLGLLWKSSLRTWRAL